MDMNVLREICAISCAYIIHNQLLLIEINGQFYSYNVSTPDCTVRPKNMDKLVLFTIHFAILYRWNGVFAFVQ